MLYMLTILLVSHQLTIAPDLPGCRLEIDIAADTRKLALDTVTLQKFEDDVQRIWQPYFVDVVFRARGSAPVEHLALIVDDGNVTRDVMDRADVAWVVFASGTPIPILHVSPTAARSAAAKGWTAGTPGGRVVPQLLVGRTLARAVAHEVGHYLLASRAHSATGLMRAHIPGWDFVDSNEREFALTTDQAAVILRRVASRCAERGSSR